jgi:hypothetical protein
MLSNLKFRNTPNTQHKQGIVVKINEPSRLETNMEENPVLILDFRSHVKIDRSKILEKMRGKIVEEEPARTFKESVPIIEPVPEKRRPKIVAQINLETLDTGMVPPKETNLETGPRLPTVAVKRRPKIVAQINAETLLAEPIQQARREAISATEIAKRVPKPVNYDKIILRASSYYMNNRKLYLQKINQFFGKYKKQLAEIEENISCENRNQSETRELFLHQKIVRDYLNIYTPYRGLLLYHGLGSGKTCTSIAIAEGMKSHKEIIIMTPASLKTNFFAELKKCGDQLYKKEQYWSFIPTEGNPVLAQSISKALGLPLSYIEKVKPREGAWFVDIRQPSNFAALDSDAQQQIDDQLNAMIRAKYKDVNYNGLNWNIVNQWTKDKTVNPFDNKVVIIDEAHNFVSRIVNKIKKPNSISFLLYNYLMAAENAKIVLLTGTPIINYPNEIAILFNILRGFIKTWSMQVRVNTRERVNRDMILDLFEKEGFHIYDYVEYTGNTLTITRNPYGFVNTTATTKDKIPRPRGRPPKGTAKVREQESYSGGGSARKTKKLRNVNPRLKIHKEDVVIHVDVDEEPTDEEIKESEETAHLYTEMYKEDPHKGGTLSPDFAVNATTMYAMPTISGGDTNAFETYNGVRLDETGNVSDEVFIRRVTDILKKYDIDVVQPSLQLTLNKALPDDSEQFISRFISSNKINQDVIPTFKRRVLGLTSYFRSAQETLLPQFVETAEGDQYHIVPCVMSNYQYGEYAVIRKDEADREKSQRLRQKMQKESDGIFNVASSYRIFSRACCNFAFPKPPGRPLPNAGNKPVNEKELDALPGPEEEEEGEDADVEEGENGEPIENTGDYGVRIQRAMAALAYDPAKPAEQNYLSPEGLEIYSPKFLKILENLQNPDHIGLHLLYSNFRTIEGIGILRLVLQANGFVEFKLEHGNSGVWSIADNSLPDENEEPKKPRFVLYTGTESTEEKEIIRNIYNSNWSLVPKTIVTQLEESRLPNNFMGEVIKLIMITAAGAEGINLKNTRYVHIVEPYWNMVRLEQVIGRASRICSHADLVPELRTIQVFLYLSVFSKEQRTDEKNIELRLRDVSRRDKKTPITTDESLYEISILKDAINKELLKSIKETAIDCSVYSGSNSKESLVCYGFGKVKSNQFASYPILEQDLGEKEEGLKQTVKIQKVKIGEKMYALNAKTNELYDIEDYERSKKSAANLIPIGRLRKGPDGVQIVDI